MSDIAAVIHKARLLTGFAEEDIDAFVAAAERRQVPEGTVVLEADAPNHSLFLLIRGAMQVTRETGDKILDLALLQAGQTFGEMSFLDGSRTSANLIAACECEFLEMPRRSLETLLVQRPQLVAQLWYNVALGLKQRLAKNNELIDHYMELNQRLLASHAP